MITTSAAAPLAVTETERIAALLAEVSGHAAPRPNVSPPPLPATIEARTSARLLLERANWRNEDLQAEPVHPSASPGLDDGVRDGPLRPTSPSTELKPLPAPFGVLTVASLFDLMNWRNRPENAKPLPLIKPPPPPGSEFTVGAVMTTFGWE